MYSVWADSSDIKFDELNAKKWAIKIWEISQEENKTNIMKEKTHEIVANSFTWDSLADLFIDVYLERKMPNK